MSRFAIQIDLQFNKQKLRKQLTRALSLELKKLFNIKKNIILNEMKMQEGKNYQPVMIRYLNQNRGKATRKEIQEALHQANLEYPTKYFQDSPVFDVLTTSHQVADYNSKEDTYALFDYNTYTPAQKAHITMYCDE